MTKPMSHESDERLADWVDEAMTPRERQRFEAELRVSKPLRDRLLAYEKTVRAVRNGLAQQDASMDVSASVMERIRAADGGSSPSNSLARSMPSLRLSDVPGAWWRSALVAAAIVAVIAVLDRWEPRKERKEQAVAEAPEAAMPKLEAVTALREESELGAAKPDAGAVSEPALAARTPRRGVDAPRTMVPEVRFRLTADADTKLKAKGDAAGAAPNSLEKAVEQTAAANAGAGARYGGADVLFGDLASSVRAIGGLSVQTLAPVDASKAAADTRVFSMAVSTPRTWLVTGTSAEVRAFLANLADAGSSAGYEVSNGEVAAAEVDARIPLASAKAVGIPSAGGPSSAGPAGPGGGKAAEPMVRVVVIIESKAN
ncbi:MAG: hypothetical protein RLZZ562_2496 [Planctomycetota bacterium]